MSIEKQIEELADDIHMNCHACLLTYEAEMIARFVIEERGYRKQREGEWIAKKEMYRTPSTRNYYCSNCEKNAPFDSFMGVSRITNYCPNCGAKMKAVRNEKQ